MDQQQYNSNLKAAPYTSSGRDVIMVPSFYEMRHPFMRKEFQAVREWAEMGANSSAEKRLEMAQASVETDEGINAKDLPVTNEVPSLICYLQKLLLNQIPQRLKRYQRIHVVMGRRKIRNQN